MNGSYFLSAFPSSTGKLHVLRQQRKPILTWSRSVPDVVRDRNRGLWWIRYVGSWLSLTGRDLMHSLPYAGGREPSGNFRSACGKAGVLDGGPHSK